MYILYDKMENTCFLRILLPWHGGFYRHPLRDASVIDRLVAEAAFPYFHVPQMYAALRLGDVLPGQLGLSYA